MTPPDGAPDWSLRALVERHSLADLPEQFVLSESGLGPSSWPAETVGSWTLRRHPTLPRVRLLDQHGTQVGWLLGYPVSDSGTLWADGSSAGPVAPAGVTTRAWLDTLGGRWAAVVAAGPAPAVHLDAAGSLSLVYVPSLRLVASTPGLVPYETGLDDRDDLAGEMGLPWSKTAMFPLGMTSRHGVWRLLPNHVLDLTAFAAHREWPTRPWAYDPDLDTTVRRIAELTRRNVVAATGVRPGLMPLTAGRDSRMLLACIRDVSSELSYVTTAFPDMQGEVDCWLASRIARSLGLRHQVLTLQQPRQSDLEDWLLRVGCSVSEVRGWQSSTSVASLGSGWVTLTANIGETGRGRRWQDDDRHDTVITPERLLRHSKAPVSEETVAVARSWLAGVPLDNALQVLSLFYVEETLGSWAGVIPYAEYAGPGFTMLPMNHAEIIRRMLALPEDVQRSRRLPEAVIEAYWPDLMRWPFNEETGLRGVRRKVRRAARRVLR